MEGLGGGGAGGAAAGLGHEVDAGGEVGGGGAKAVAEMLGGDLLPLPVHAGGAGVVDLHAVHADVPFAGGGVAGDDAGQGDEAAAILRPRLQDGQLEKVDLVAGVDDLLAGGIAGGDDPGEEAADLRQHRQHLQLVHHAGGGLGVEQGADAVGDTVERIDVEGELHAGLGAELIHEDTGAGMTFDVLEEQGGSAGPGRAAAELGGAVGDLGHLEDRVDRLRDALEFPCLVELADEGT